MADPAPQMAPPAAPIEPGATGDAPTGQPKPALNYRLGGDHCGACMYFSPVGPSKGTCPRVVPPDVDAGDLCDDFKRAARERPDAEVATQAGPTVNPMVESLQRRGMISDKAMAGMRGGA